MTPQPDPPPTLLLAEEVWGSTLHAMRSLHAEGSPVYVAVAGTGAHIYRRSRACAAAIDLADGGAAACAAITRWMDLVQPAGPVVVLPTSDRWVEVLHRHRRDLPDRFLLCIPNAPLTESLLDKSRSLRVADDAGLLVPEWAALTQPSHLDRIDDLPVPIALRPTKWSTTGANYFKISVHRDRASARARARAALDDGAELVAQRYLQEPEDHVELAIVWRSLDGATTAVCTGRKRRQSAPEGGVMVWGNTEEIPDVGEATMRFLDHTGFTGLGGIEFIRTDRGLEFIEFNPRLEAIHFLATAAGIDTVALAYADIARDTRPTLPPAQRRATAWVGSAWYARMRNDRHYRVAALRDRIEFARSPNRASAVVSWSDPRPAMALSRSLLSRATTNLRRRVAA